jgi:hypothetical protein
MEAFIWINHSKQRRNGRLAYLTLITHYLCASKNETLQNQADSRLLKTFYGGEKNKCDWTKYVLVHKQCQNDLEATGSPLGEDDKVQQLLNGINTQKLDTTFLFMRSSPLLISNFNVAVDSISNFIENIQESFKWPFQQMSGTATGPLDGSRGCGRRNY